MNNYRFIYRLNGHSDHQFECDADAMMAAREELKTMQKLNKDEQVYV